MESLVYLVHRIPYPPNKGDKIRSYHWLRFLAERYRVHLGTFVDDVNDWRHVGKLESLCTDVCAVGLDPRLQRLRSMAALLRGEPLTLPYYRNRELQSWVDRKINDEHVTRVLVFSSPMAQYVAGTGGNFRKVIDFVDVDSEKWTQYAERRSWPMKWLFRREGARLLEFEREVASSASANVFVTDEEADLFRRRAPAVTALISSVLNGVDTEYFSPERPYASPYPAGGPVVVFTGMMDYGANVDAVRWFAEESFPIVRERHPDARFYIVGARPTRAVKRLAAMPGVAVTGSVDDVRPFLACAKVAVAPLRIARGIQNKVLEAAAMARPIVATTAAMVGLELPNMILSHVVDDVGGLADKVAERLKSTADENAAFGTVLRSWVRGRHDWDQTLKPLEALIA